ncbi:MAG: threonine synthase, partial [Gammaproteobacteria bacterium]|nr:threonine synthase [Gammaproteobacteria bacterium]
MKNDCLQYISTRGHQKKLKFHDVIFEGLAPDGGLYIPESWPILEKSIISSFVDKNYFDIAYDIFLPYIDDTIDKKDLKSIIKLAYQ